jgi:hypothetical protein
MPRPLLDAGVVDIDAGAIDPQVSWGTPIGERHAIVLRRDGNKSRFELWNLDHPKQPVALDTFANVQAAWERRGPTHWSASGGYVRGSFRPELSGQETPASVERLSDGPVPTLFPGDGTRERAALAISGESAVERFAGARHELRYGLSGEWTRATTGPDGPAGFTAETVGGLAARAWDYGWAGPESRRRGLATTLDVADRASRGRLRHTGSFCRKPVPIVPITLAMSAITAEAVSAPPAPGPSRVISRTR